ncbi:MAG TPA: hypothetical protein VEI74_12450 [Candidatus Methylomirabilis sp.]|nr:hypothetical protein [Candidatus Methylomirabilis sp.]
MIAYIIRLAIALFSLSLIHFSSAEAASSEDIPNWLVPIVKSYSEAKKNAVLIAEYEFHNQRVYEVDRTKACCDLGADMYSESGERICRFIGYAGAWETPCNDFSSKSKLVRIIYENKTVPNPSFNK